MSKWFRAAFLVVTAAQFINLFPTLLSFERFAFGDCGWPLVVDGLLDEGQTPTVDFAYFYGLLTLLIDRAAFAVFGRTPEVVVGIFGACTLVIAVGAVRTATALNLRLFPSLFLLACAALITIPRGFPSPAHALEAALLMTAVADHAARRPGRALVLVTLAVLVKPSLAYVYGLILVLLVVSGWPGGGSRWRPLLPAAGVGAAALGLLAAVFGWGPVAKTVVPVGGMAVYGGDGVGFFFGAGSRFWWPEEPTVEYYLGAVPGIWLASSVVLVGTAARVLPRLREPAACVTVTCAALHAVFVVLLFGNRWSWIYYPHLLFVGTAVALHCWPRRAGGVLAVVLTAWAVAGQSGWLWATDAAWWFDTRRAPETGGLYASAADAADWAAARELGKTSRVFVLTPMGCPQLIAPELDGPRWWCLIEPIMTPAEAARVKGQLAAADWLVSPFWHDNDVMEWAAFRDDLRPFQLVRATPRYRLYQRRP